MGNPNANFHGHGHTHGISDLYKYAHGHCYPADPGTHGDDHVNDYVDADSHSHSNRVPNAHSDCQCHRYGHGDAYPDLDPASAWFLAAPAQAVGGAERRSKVGQSHLGFELV